MSDINAMTEVERHAMYDDLRSLTADEWASPTVCGTWTVKHLAAHLVALGTQTAPNFFGGLVRNGFSFDRFVDRDLQRWYALPTDDLLSAFRATLANPRTPPGPQYVSLGELMVHGGDIRRAIGRPIDHRAAHVEALAPRYARAGGPIGGKRRAAGLTLRATDAEWSHGDGPEVVGPGAELIRALTGRADGLDQCSGPGLDTLRSRCA